MGIILTPDQIDRTRDALRHLLDRDSQTVADALERKEYEDPETAHLYHRAVDIEDLIDDFETRQQESHTVAIEFTVNEIEMIQDRLRGGEHTPAPAALTARLDAAAQEAAIYYQPSPRNRALIREALTAAGNTALAARFERPHRESLDLGRQRQATPTTEPRIKLVLTPRQTTAIAEHLQHEAGLLQDRAENLLIPPPGIYSAAEAEQTMQDADSCLYTSGQHEQLKTDLETGQTEFTQYDLHRMASSIERHYGYNPDSRWMAAPTHIVDALATIKSAERDIAAHQTPHEVTDVHILAGSDLPEQLHLGRRCSLEWVNATDYEPYSSSSLGVKPQDALWTSSTIHESDAGAATAWSERFFRTGHDAARREEASTWSRFTERFQPHKLWPITPDDDARIVALKTVDDLVAAAARWPGPHGHISFQRMRNDGIDGVWVSPDVLPRAWDSTWERQQPHSTVRGQFYAWDTETTVWLRSEKLTVGPPRRVDRDYRLDNRSSGPDRGVLKAKTPGLPTSTTGTNHAGYAAQTATGGRSSAPMAKRPGGLGRGYERGQQRHHPPRL